MMAPVHVPGCDAVAREEQRSNEVRSVCYECGRVVVLEVLPEPPVGGVTIRV